MAAATGSSAIERPTRRRSTKKRTRGAPSRGRRGTGSARTPRGEARRCSRRRSRAARARGARRAAGRVTRGRTPFPRRPQARCRRPAHDGHVQALERAEQLGEPALLGEHVAVDEDEPVAARPVRTEVLQGVVGDAAHRYEDDVGPRRESPVDERSGVVAGDVLVVVRDDQLRRNGKVLDLGRESLQHPGRTFGRREPQVVELEDDRHDRSRAHVASRTRPLRLPAHQKRTPRASTPRSAAASRGGRDSTVARQTPRRSRVVSGRTRPSGAKRRKLRP